MVNEHANTTAVVSPPCPEIQQLLSGSHGKPSWSDVTYGVTYDTSTGSGELRGSPASLETSPKAPSWRPSLFCFKESHVFLNCCPHCLEGRSSGHVTTATSTPLLSTPSSCRALQCMDAEISLIGPPVQPSASLPRTLCALPPCHSSKVPLCLSVPCLSSCLLSTSKPQKHLIKGGFTFKPVQQVKLHAGEQLTPTMCYLLSVCCVWLHLHHQSAALSTRLSCKSK